MDATASIEGADFFRRSPAPWGGMPHHKEWQHFIVLAPGLDLLVNFSFCDDARTRAGPADELPRLIVMARDHRGWFGDVDTFLPEQARAPGGVIDCSIGSSSLRFAEGAYRIDARLRDRDVSVDLCLAPRTDAAFVPNIPMLDGPPLHWVVVPRCSVSGSVILDGLVHELHDAPGYHDHNWGHFLWGHDVAWEWGFVLPDDESVPWCFTFVRLTDRSRTRALSHGLFVWNRFDQVALFREGDATFHGSLARHRSPEIFRIPRVMALASPRRAADVPAEFAVAGRRRDDWLECRCVPEALAQVLIPSEAKLGTTIFNEVVARSHVRGEIRGESFEFTGRSILEFIRA